MVAQKRVQHLSITVKSIPKQSSLTKVKFFDEQEEDK